MNKILKFIPRIIREDFVRKLIAIVFAVLIYEFVNNKMGKEASIEDVVVNIKYPANLVSLETTLPTVTLRIRASERQLNKLTSSDFSIHCEVDDHLYTQGNPYLLHIRTGNVSAPLGVTVLGMKPASITLNIDKRISQKIKIKESLTGDLPEGYGVKSIKFTPAFVTVTGPSTYLKNLKNIKTENISLDEVYEEFTMQKLKVKIPSRVNVSPKTIDAYVNIQKIIQMRSFTTLALRIIQPRSGDKFDVEFLDTPGVDVTVSGDKQIIAIMKKEDIIPCLDISKFSETGIYKIQVNCIISQPNIKLTSVYPKSVRVKLTKINK